MDLTAKPYLTSYAIAVEGPVKNVAVAHDALFTEALNKSGVPIRNPGVDTFEGKWHVVFSLFTEDDTDEAHERIRQIIREAVSEPA